MTTSPLFKRVPVEATDEMYLAALRITRDPGYGHCHDAVGGAVYRAMLAAAPEPPPTTDDGLVSLLRALSSSQHDDLSLGDEAADEIVALRERVRELERLYRERTELAEAQRRRAEAAEAKLARAKVSG